MKDFDVHVKVTVFTTHRIVADSLQAAVAAAEKISASEIIPVKVIRDSIDTELEIEGVMKA